MSHIISIENLARIPRGTTIEYSLLDRSRKDFAESKGRFAEAKDQELTPEQLKEFQKRSFFLTAFILDFNKEKNEITISRTAEIVSSRENDELEYRRMKKVPIDTLTSLAVLEKIPEYQLRDMRLRGNVLAPYDQENGVLAVIDYNVPRGGVYRTSGYIVGANLGFGFLRLAHGYKHNPLLGKASKSSYKRRDEKLKIQDAPLLYHSIEPIKYADIFSTDICRRDKELKIGK